MQINLCQFIMWGRRDVVANNCPCHSSPSLWPSISTGWASHSSLLRPGRRIYSSQSPARGHRLWMKMARLLHKATVEDWRKTVRFFSSEKCTSGRTAHWEHLCCYHPLKNTTVSTLHLASLMCTNKTNPESKTVGGGQNNDVKIRQTALSYSRNVSKSDLALDS